MMEDVWMFEEVPCGMLGGDPGTAAGGEPVMAGISGFDRLSQVLSTRADVQPLLSLLAVELARACVRGMQCALHTPRAHCIPRCILRTAFRTAYRARMRAHNA